MTDRQVFMVAVGELKADPDQPRKTFNPEDVESMASTIEAQGVINPIEIDGDNVIVTGQLRWMAAEKAGLSEVPCIVWEGDAGERFERQVVENLNHHELPDGERENAITKLWETGRYDTQKLLGKAVGLTQQRISQILEVNEFRKRTQVQGTGISTNVISETAGLSDHTREQILKAVESKAIKADDIREVRRIAQTSDALLEKTLSGDISLERARETAEAIRDIEEETALTDAQKDRYVSRIEQDEGTLRQYKDDVRERVKEVMTATPSERAAIRTQAPAGRDSPVDKFTAVRDEVENFASYLGGCDADERAWIRRILLEIRAEVNKTIDMIRAPE